MTLRLGVLLLLGLLLAAGLYGVRLTGGGQASAASPELRIIPQQSEPGRPLLMLTGLPAPPGPAGPSLIFLTSDRPDDAEALPVLGSVSFDAAKRALLYQPRVRLTPGKRYTAVWRGLNGQAPIYLEYREPEAAADGPPSVEQVYPPGEEVPVNLLKFYVRFSRPMQQGKVFENVRLLDASGRPVDQAFHEQELWDDDSRRLTLWINPGRTKHGLGLSDALGPVLSSGGEYVLEVGAGLSDTSGRPLGSPFRRRFRTGAPDMTQPKPKSWRVTAPAAGSTEPVKVTTGEALDFEMARSLINVRDGSGNALPGEIVADWETRKLTFQPEAAWRAERYSLVVPGDLEDMSGNSVRRPFESASRGERPSPEAGEVLIGFEPAAASAR